MECNFTVRKRGNKWHLVCSYKTSTGWKQKTKGGFDFRKEALSTEAKSEMIKQIENEAKLEPSFKNVTFPQMLEFYLSQNSTLAYNTKMVYRNSVKNLGPLNQIPMKDVKLMDILNLLRPMSVSKQREVRKVLGMLYRSAVMYKAISENPLLGYKFPPLESDKKTKRLRTFTEEEIADVMGAVDSEADLIMAIAAATGMRCGEILGLTWSDIDFINNEIHVSKQWKLLSKENNKYVYGWGDVKNKHGNRTLYLPPSLRRILLEYKSRHPINISGRISRFDTAARVNEYVRRRFPNHSMHDFRHTFGTRLSLSCPNVTIIAATLGDAEETVLKTYLDFNDEMRRQAQNHIAAMFQ